MSALPNSLFPVPSAPIPQNQSRGESFVCGKRREEGENRFFEMTCMNGERRWTYLDEFCVARTEEHLLQVSVLCKLEFQHCFHLIARRREEEGAREAREFVSWAEDTPWRRGPETSPTARPSCVGALHQRHLWASDHTFVYALQSADDRRGTVQTRGVASAQDLFILIRTNDDNCKKKMTRSPTLNA